MPSETKPSTDQVLTNTFVRLRLLGALGVALGDVDALDAELVRELAPSRLAALRLGDIDA